MKNKYKDLRSFFLDSLRKPPPLLSWPEKQIFCLTKPNQIKYDKKFTLHSEFSVCLFYKSCPYKIYNSCHLIKWTLYGLSKNSLQQNGKYQFRFDEKYNVIWSVMVINWYLSQKCNGNLMCSRSGNAEQRCYWMSKVIKEWRLFTTKLHNYC